MGFVNSLSGAPVTIVIEEKTTTYNAYNQPTGEAWATVATVSGRVQLGSMAQSVVSDQFAAIVAAVAFIDPEDLAITITEAHRILVGGIYYSIIYVENIEGVSIEIPLKLWTA